MAPPPSCIQTLAESRNVREILDALDEVDCLVRRTRNSFVGLADSFASALERIAGSPELERSVGGPIVVHLRTAIGLGAVLATSRLVKALLRVLKGAPSFSLRTVSECINALIDIVVHASMADFLRAEGCVEALLSSGLLEDARTNVLAWTCTLLNHLCAENDDVKSKLASPKTVASIIRLLDDPDAEVQTASAKLVNSLTRNQAFKRLFFSGGGLDAIMRLLRDGSNTVACAHSAIAIGQIVDSSTASSPGSRLRALNIACKGAVPLLCSLFVEESLPAHQSWYLYAMSRIARQGADLAVLVGVVPGMIETLLQLCTQGEDAELQHASAYLLSCVAECSEACALMLRFGACRELGETVPVEENKAGTCISSALKRMARSLSDADADRLCHWLRRQKVSLSAVVLMMDVAIVLTRSAKEARSGAYQRLFDRSGGLQLLADALCTRGWGLSEATLRLIADLVFKLSAVSTKSALERADERATNEELRLAAVKQKGGRWDMVLRVGTLDFAVHSSVAMAASEMLRAMFKGGWAETPAEGEPYRVELRGACSPEVFAVVARYLRDGSAEAIESAGRRGGVALVSRVMQAADTLLMDALRTRCEVWIGRKASGGSEEALLLHELACACASAKSLRLAMAARLLALTEADGDSPPSRKRKRTPEAALVQRWSQCPELRESLQLVVDHAQAGAVDI